MLGNHSKLTPLEFPTIISGAVISVEPNFDHVGVAFKLNPRVIVLAKVSKYCAILISDFDKIFFCAQLKDSELHPDGVALRNLDSLEAIKIPGILLVSFSVVRRCQHTACRLLSYRSRRRT